MQPVTASNRVPYFQVMSVASYNTLWIRVEKKERNRRKEALIPVIFICNKIQTRCYSSAWRGEYYQIVSSKPVFKVLGLMAWYDLLSFSEWSSQWFSSSGNLAKHLFRYSIMVQQVDGCTQFCMYSWRYLYIGKMLSSLVIVSLWDGYKQQFLWLVSSQQLW